MKEGIVIKIPKDMCDNCNSCDRPTSAQIECYLEEPRQLYETVKVPETFEELKELCKGRNKIRIANVEGTESIILNDNVICDKYGTVFVEFSENTYCFAKDRTIPQTWAFIKSLIGEE